MEYQPSLPLEKPAPVENIYKPEAVPPALTALAVEGVALCQSCKLIGSRSLSYASPLPGAKVKLVCQSGYRYQTFLHATARTDYNGFFILRVRNFDFKTFNPLKDCVVKLVYSPYTDCSMATDIINGKSGAPL